MPNKTDISVTASKLSNARNRVDTAQRLLSEVPAPSSERISTLTALVNAVADEATWPEVPWVINLAQLKLEQAELTRAEEAHATATGE